MEEVIARHGLRREEKRGNPLFFSPLFNANKKLKRHLLVVREQVALWRS